MLSGAYAADSSTRDSGEHRVRHLQRRMLKRPVSHIDECVPYGTASGQQPTERQARSYAGAFNGEVPQPGNTWESCELPNAHVGRCRLANAEAEGGWQVAPPRGTPAMIAATKHKQYSLTYRRRCRRRAAVGSRRNATWLVHALHCSGCYAYSILAWKTTTMHASAAINPGSCCSKWRALEVEVLCSGSGSSSEVMLAA